MAVTFVAANTGTTVAYASSISVTKPTNTNGDLIIAIVGGKMSGAPSGWTMLETSGNGAGGSLDQCNVFYKFASSEGTGSYTFTLSSSQLGCAAVLAYRGVDNVNPIDTTNKSIGTASGTNYTPSSITATADQKALAFAVGYRFGTGTVSQWSEGVSPTITSERADFGRTGSGDNTSMVVAEYDNISGSFAPTITRAATSDTGYKGSFLINAQPVGTSPVNYVAHSQASNSTGSTSSSLAPAKIAGTAQGDLIIATVMYDPSTTLTVPSGFTLQDSVTDGSLYTAAIYTKIATGSEPSTYTWSVSSAQPWSVDLQGFRSSSERLTIAHTGTTTNFSQTGSTIDTILDGTIVFTVRTGYLNQGFTYTTASPTNAGTHVVDVGSPGTSPGNVTRRIGGWRTTTPVDAGTGVGGYTIATTSSVSVTGSVMFTVGIRPSGLAPAGGIDVDAFGWPATIAPTGPLSASAPSATSTLGAEVDDHSTLGVLAPSATSELSGTATVSGELTSTAPVAEAEAVGGPVIDATLSAAAPTAQAALSVTATVAGALSATAPTATAAAGGEATAMGTMAGAAPAVDGSFVGSVAGGSLAAVAPGATGAVAGELTAFTTGFGSTAPEVEVEFAGDIIGGATLTATAPQAGAALSGAATVGGAVDSTAPAVQVSADAEVEVVAALGASSPAATAGLDAEVGVSGALDGNAPAAQSSLTGSASGGGLAAVAPAADVSIAGDATVSGVVAFAAPTAEASMSGDLIGSSDVHAIAPSATASLAGITVVSGTADADAPQATATLAGSTSTNGGAISAQAPEATAQLDATSTVSGSLDSGAPSAEMGIDATATVSGTVSATAPGATASILGAYLSAHFAASAPEATSSLAGSVTAAGELTAESPHPDSGDTGLALHVKVTVKDEFAAEAPNAGADLAGSASLGGSVDAAAPGADASLDGDVFEHPQAVVDAVAPMVGADLDGELTVAAILAAPSPYATADIDGERPLPDGPLDADAPMPELVGAGAVGLSGSLGVAVIGPLVSMDGLSDVSIDGILNALAPTASSSMRDTPKQRRVRVEAEIREVIITRDGQTAVIAYEDRTVE